jgi:ribosomal protein S18 acetylase RimI-like enzyme
VADSCRGQGYFRQYFNDCLLALARQMAVDRLELDVGLDNPNASAIYDRLGFHRGISKPYRGKANIEGITRLYMTLP